MRNTKTILRDLIANPAIQLAESCFIVFSFVVLSPLSSQTQAQTQNLNAEADARFPAAIYSQAIELQLGDDQLHAYDQRLIDPLFQQARFLQEMGSHSDALRLFKEALHIERINHGLYNEKQIVLLDYLIESEIALQDWESVDRHYSYMEHLYRRLYTLQDPRLEIGMQKVVSWHVNALNVNVDGKRMEHLSKANSLFKLRLQIAELTLTADDPKLDFLIENIEICERQLYLASDLNKEIQRGQQHRERQNSLLANSE